MRKSSAAVGITGLTVVAAIAYFIFGLFGPGKGPGGGDGGNQKGGPGGQARDTKQAPTPAEMKRDVAGPTQASTGAAPQQVRVDIKDYQYLVDGEAMTLEQVVDLANRMSAEHGSKARIDVVPGRDARITAIDKLTKQLDELAAQNKIQVFKGQQSASSSS